MEARMAACTGVTKMPHDLEANKQRAIAFYRTACMGDPAEAVQAHVGDDYTQHNPSVGDGRQAFIAYFDEMARDYPGKRIAFVRANAEGDLVALHTHQTWPGGDQYVTMDFFRFDDRGRIVEHWDATQQIPPTSKNGSPMY
jgi:predicted SnoaL-like aldol condensation-catalyzing enzyme